MPRDITPPPPARPTKRTRVYRACQYCVSAKTRCEDVRPEGCFICRRKGKVCSLAGLSSAETNGNGAHEPNDDLSEKVQRQEERYRVLEERFNALEHAFTNRDEATPKGSVRSNLEHAPTPSRYYTKTSHPLLLQSWHGSTPMFDENLFNPTDPDSLPDVVELGLISRPQLEMGFQLFKHKFSSIYPFHTFLHTSTSVPCQSFLTLAILYYINSDCSTSAGVIPVDNAVLIDLIERSILSLLSGSTSAESIFALFILSFAPTKKSLSSRQQPSSLRVISLAYDLGKSLGWNQKTHLASRGGLRNGLFESWMSKKLDLVLLWTAIINRYNILHIISTPYDVPIESPAPYLPDDHPSASESVRMTITHLRKEAELVNRVKGYIYTLYQVECEIELEPESLSRCIDEVKCMRKDLHDFREGLSGGRGGIGHDSLEYDSKCIEFALIIRLSAINQSVPSPISLAIKWLGLSTIGQNYLPTSLALIDIVLARASEDGGGAGISSLPSYLINSICLAYICLRRSLVYIYANRRSIGQEEKVQYRAQVDLLLRAQDILMGLGGTPELLVDYTNRQLGDLESIVFPVDHHVSNSNPNDQLHISSTGPGQMMESTNMDLNVNMNQNMDMTMPHLGVGNGAGAVPIDWSNWDWSALLVDPFSFDMGVGPVE
ncbi:hypothetical protein I302_103620 [Kwoniella bestiolae CBS 10118]|uniref:Zn(2)-C6 fungal-type domain-containing protein n=1 Tax=Kwoniella bestiolae CBS 10118 TaxID=1296100 RepID=A0A1B9G918_9TREE|nr:hypothetical protein I302_02323 [Kwoniella bestiolae CBS 10118]OCF27481.1 hypothetical protein I302_02323 [Kwoniella bestiolae CBS 10118]